MYLVSACLAGVNCRYNGSNSVNEHVRKLLEEGRAIPVCPEVIGGLPIPRANCEIIEDDNDTKKIVTKEGQDVTQQFISGAQKTLEIAKVIGAKKAILKSKSPSCGYGEIYDGQFSGNLIKGNGFAAELLAKNGIKIYNDNDIVDEKVLLL